MMTTAKAQSSEQRACFQENVEQMVPEAEEELVRSGLMGQFIFASATVRVRINLASVNSALRPSCLFYQSLKRPWP